jgi:hypothetical protein
MGMKLEERSEYARTRKARILQYITQDPPVSLYNVMSMEGMSERPLRVVLKELEQEHGVKYLGTAAARDDGGMPYGLTDASNRLRSNLANALYRVTNPHNEFGFKGRNQVAAEVGLNPREQIRAEQTPFRHNWTLSQIERLARVLGEEPREFLLKCSTT